VFNEVSERYDRVRPGCPDELFADGFGKVDVGTSTVENWDDRGRRVHREPLLDAIDE
jgi:hypothetical protein